MYNWIVCDFAPGARTSTSSSVHVSAHFSCDLIVENLGIEPSSRMHIRHHLTTSQPSSKMSSFFPTYSGRGLLNYAITHRNLLGSWFWYTQNIPADSPSNTYMYKADLSLINSSRDIFESPIVTVLLTKSTSL